MSEGSVVGIGSRLLSGVKSEKYIDIISSIKQLDVNDDGFESNWKIQHILEIWNKNCETREEVEKSFASLYESSLRDEELASKFANMIASGTFTSQEIQDTNIRFLLLRHLQLSFTDRTSMKAMNPAAFRNSVRMLGDFFNKACLSNGEKLTFLVISLFHYLEILLESSSSEDLQLFATQLFLNGSYIKSAYPEELVELLNNARLKMVCDPSLTKESKIWILLAIDVSSISFGFLPREKFEFYLEHLDHTALTKFQGAPTKLSVLTIPKGFFPDHSSDKHVLQICESTIRDSPSEDSSSSGFSSDSCSQYSSLEFPTIFKKAGVGARLLKYKNSQNTQNN